MKVARTNQQYGRCLNEGWLDGSDEIHDMALDVLQSILIYFILEFHDYYPDVLDLKQ